MNRSAWRGLRKRVIDEAHGHCFWCRRAPESLDVVPMGITNAWLALCRSCRLRRDGKARAAKAAATRQAKKAQLTLLEGRAA